MRVETIKIGLVGLGGIGRRHLFNSMCLRNARLLAVADTSKEARNLARKAGVREIYDNYDKLLQNSKIDCVVISAPTFLHAECATRAAECGKHILIEKPLARNVEEGKQIVSKARKNGIKAMIGYPLRFSHFAELKKEMDSGRFGDIISCFASNVSYGPFYHRVDYSSGQTSVPKPVPSWWFDPELVGGGALMDLGSHMIDLLRWYFGDDISSIKTVLGHRFDMPFEDMALCQMKFKQGTLGTVNVGWYSMKPVMKIDLFGIADNASMSGNDEEKLSVFGALRKRIIGKASTQASSWYKELDYFINCIIRDRAPSPSVEDGLKDLQMISLAYQNATQF